MTKQSDEEWAAGMIALRNGRDVSLAYTGSDGGIETRHQWRGNHNICDVSMFLKGTVTIPPKSTVSAGEALVAMEGGKIVVGKHGMRLRLNDGALQYYVNNEGWRVAVDHQKAAFISTKARYTIEGDA